MKVLLALVLLAWFGLSLGLLIGSVSERGELIEKVWHPISYIMFPLSGAAFLVESLPTSTQNFALWLPMVHGVEMLRDGYFGSAFRAQYDVGYLVFWNLVLTFSGLIQVRVVAKRIHTG
jgi:ABC-2 type transport system permease protein/capsular polysaccharide transport system permease protein